MAKTYLQINPESEIVVVDKASTVGGSWAEERLYHGLKTNNRYGTYEFADFPMVPAKYGGTGKGHIPGRVVHEYLSDFTVHFGIDQYLRLSTAVKSATLREDGKWTIVLQNLKSDLNSRTIITATRLVIATGLTSEPNIPRFSGRSSFDGLIIHSKQLRELATPLSKCKDVVVLGGNKSAWDVCYDAAQSGARVNMVIRPSGSGPSYIWPREFRFGPFLLSLAMISSTRLATLFDPFSLGVNSMWHSFLHRTYIGGKMCQMFWKGLDYFMRNWNGYNTHPELQKLQPWFTPFWMGNSLSIHNYETSWFDLVRQGKIRIHIADVTALSKGTVHLSDGDRLETEALVCCTGWKADPPLNFQPADVATSLSLTKTLTEADPFEIRAEQQLRTELRYLDTIERRVLQAPKLSNGTTLSSSGVRKLYRLSIPCHLDCLVKRNIAFIGAHSSIHAAIVAQAQALWVTAFFQGEIEHLDLSKTGIEKIKYDAAFDGVYARLRRPHELGGSGGKYVDLVFDSIPYVDLLLRDLGLNPRRKKTWWKEWLESYNQNDYRGLTSEWLNKPIL